MSKFNVKDSTSIKATSYEGGAVYKKNPLQDWFNFISSSMMADGLYESASEQQKRYINLTNDIIDTYGAEFAAKAAVFARNELGMRSIAHLTAAMLNSEQFANKRAFFKRICHRPDDAAEILAAIDILEAKRGHATLRGMGDYLSSINAYTLGKYKMKGHTYNMFDLINLTHAHSSVIDRYKAGESLVSDTWETAISGSTTQEEKNKEWGRLVREGKLGYLALIRNLNNILATEDIDLMPYLIKQLLNKDSIRKSLVFPYQIYIAYKNLTVRNTKIIGALEKAFEYSIENMPKLDGVNCIVLDVSGSMEDRFGRTCLTIKEAAAVYGIALYYANGATTLIKFGNTAKKVEYNCFLGAFNLIERFCESDDCGYGTDIGSAFRKMREEFDRIFVFSDMQVTDPEQSMWSWYGHGEKGIDSFRNYALAYNNKCNLYSFDLSNYATQIENPNDKRVHLLTSLTDKTFQMIPWLEDEGTLFEYISNLSYA